MMYYDLSYLNQKTKDPDNLLDLLACLPKSKGFLIALIRSGNYNGLKL